jgi:hypothetical protein
MEKGSREFRVQSSTLCKSEQLCCLMFLTPKTDLLRRIPHCVQVCNTIMNDFSTLGLDICEAAATTWQSFVTHTPKEVSQMRAVSIHSNRTQHATWVSPLQRSPHRWWVLKSQLQRAKLLERGQNNKLTTHGCQRWSAGGASGGGGSSLQPITHRPRDGSQTKRGGSQTQGLLVTFIMNSMDC